MKSNYKAIGNYIRQVSTRNKDGALSSPMGIKISKIFMPSVANTIGTDLSKYRVVSKNQFAYNPMHVGRDEVLPIALQENDEPIIVSPAYVVFEIIDHEVLDPEYLMMWCRRSEFDREAWFTTDSSVRGGFSWNALCEMQMPIPSIAKQREIVKEYNTIVNRISLNEKLNQKLEEAAQALYKHWFVDFEFPNEEGKPYRSCGGKLVYNNVFDMELPANWAMEEIEKIISVKDGTHDSPSLSIDGFPLVTSKNLKPYATDLIDTYFVSEVDYEQINRRSKVDQYDILFSMIGTVGLISFVQDKEVKYAIKNVGLFKTSMNVNIAIYVLFYLKSSECKGYIKSNLAGSTQSYVTLSVLRSIPIPIPSDTVLNKFNKVANLFVSKSYQIVQETNILIKLAEGVLSKMSTKYSIISEKTS